MISFGTCFKVGAVPFPGQYLCLLTRNLAIAFSHQIQLISSQNKRCLLIFHDPENLVPELFYGTEGLPFTQGKYTKKSFATAVVVVPNLKQHYMKSYEPQCILPGRQYLECQFGTPHHLGRPFFYNYLPLWAHNHQLKHKCF